MLLPKIAEKAIGRVLEKELENIKKLNIKNSLFILGGNKIKRHSFIDK